MVVRLIYYSKHLFKRRFLQMNTLLNITEKYIEYCKTQKCLNSKTLKAYCTDLNQFIDPLNNPYIHGYHYYALYVPRMLYLNLVYH